MQTAEDAIVAYIRAKDENRPYLMQCAFDEGARLRMLVKADAISFPPAAAGREAITNILVRRFGQAYENVRTFCLAPPPAPGCTQFSCAWLVGMSEKDNRQVRVGCGRYDWIFRSEYPCVAESLTITIEEMQTLPPEKLSSVMEWLDRLPYPWCPAAVAAASMPAFDTLGPIRHCLAKEYA